MGKVGEIKELPVADLVPYANNARTHDAKQIEMIARSIEEFGFLKPVEFSCAIGDTEVGGVPYATIVSVARDYIIRRGGFEKFAEWGLI